MTEAQKECIITESELKDLLRNASEWEFHIKPIKERVLSRPYKSDAVLEVGIDYIIQKLGQEYDDGGYNPDIPLWVQVKSDLKKLRTKDRDSQ